MFRSVNSFILGFFPDEAFVPGNTIKQDAELLGIKPDQQDSNLPDKNISKPEVSKGPDKEIIRTSEKEMSNPMREEKPLAFNDDELLLKKDSLEYNRGLFWTPPVTPLKPIETARPVQTQHFDIAIREKQNNGEWEEVFDFDEREKAAWCQLKK